MGGAVFGLFKRRGAMYRSDGLGVPGRLTGTFDIREQALIGHVDVIPEASSAGTRIEVWRENVVVATVETEPPNAHDRMLFRLPFEGRFAVSDLIRESVHLVARNARGDTGNIGLNGATQLELIRDYMGLPVEKVIDLHFTHGGNARPHLGTGWSGPEAEFTWTLDNDSLIHFPSPKPDGAYFLRLRARAFITNLVAMQKLDVFVNDELIANLVADTAEMEFNEFRFPGNVFTKKQATVRLHHPYAGRPSEHLGTGDDRRLAFAVRRISVVRMLEGAA